MAFTLEQRGRLRLADAVALPLPGGEFDETRERAFLARQSYRSFAARSLTLADLGNWFKPLQAMPVGDSALAKRLYPSAGSLYPVRVYVVVKPNAVDELDGGAYTYDASTHQLVRLGDGAFHAEDFGELNRSTAASAAVAVFLIGHLPAIRPLYGAWARDACLLEAGYIGQTLAQAGIALNIGSCAIGSVDEDRFRKGLVLQSAETDVFLHTLLAGPIEVGTAAALAADAGRRCGGTARFRGVACDG